MTINTLVAFPVILPLLAAALRIVIPNRLVWVQRTISISTLTAVLAVAIFLVYTVSQNGPLVLSLGGWAPPVGIVLVADTFATLMLAVSAAVTLGVLVYSIGQGVADDDDSVPLAVFHPSYLILVAGVANTFLAGDLFNLYVGFEILLVASYVLLTVGGSSSRIRAGTTYVIIGVVSSVLFLLGIGLVYASMGTLNMAQISERALGLPEGVRLLIELILIVAFGVKAAVFPLSAWLPDSYPTAPAPVTAVFAGLLTKVGVYSIIRTETLFFPEGTEATIILMIAALATMLIGIYGAIAQVDIKRMLSFTLVSHIGYMLFGVALMTPLGLTGAVYYVMHHITVQTALFLTAGLIERRGGSTAINRLGGLARLAPVVAILFFVPAMNLAGIPPFSGFIGKLGLINAGIETGTPLAWTLVVGSVLTSLLTLYAIAKVWNRAFWSKPTEEILAISELTAQTDAVRGDELRPAEILDTQTIAAVREGEQPQTHPMRARRDELADIRLPEGMSGKAIVVGGRFPRPMLGATIGLVALSIGLTLFAGPLVELSEAAANELLNPSVYIEAVFPSEQIPTTTQPLSELVAQEAG